MEETLKVLKEIKEKLQAIESSLECAEKSQVIICKDGITTNLTRKSE